MGSRWKTISASQIPIYECVYAIYVDSKLIYVGQTNNLYNRLVCHAKRGGFDFRSARVLVKVSHNRRYGEHAMRELRLIARVNPEANRHHRVGRSKPWATATFRGLLAVA
jgi:hypothetical protein